MSPYEHGEVFVTDDGAETDLDLGHYERFTDVSLNKNCSVTSGKIYQSVINKERKGDYLGKTVQVIPHITNEIKENIYSFENSDVDVVITELGGTVGDMEGVAFIEAIRQVGLEKLPEDVLYIHVTLLPYISGSNEVKSKPTQHAVKELQSFGIKPDILVCRTEIEISAEIRSKLALFCNVRPENVIQNLTANNLYEVPLMLEEQGLAVAACEHLKLDKIKPQNEKWQEMINNIKNLNGTVKIAIVGKYMQLKDSYLSVAESLKHGGFANGVNVQVGFVDSEKITEENVKNILCEYDGIVVPGGFGKRGIEGMITSIKYARENDVPFLGICLGMQMAVVEYARNVLKLYDSNSEEFDKKTKNQVIHIMNEQKNITKKGGTMRLGAYPCEIKENTLAYKIYGNKNISERHRHRFEYNNDYKESLEKNGMIASGLSPDGNLVEIVEVPDNKFFIGCQFHPEFKSRPDRPAPLFRELVKATKEKAKLV